MLFKNTPRTIYGSRINEQVSFRRSVQRNSKNANYLLINLPARIVKNLNLRSKQKVVLRQARNEENKPIIIIEIEDATGIQEQNTVRGAVTNPEFPDRQESSPVSRPADPQNIP